MESIPLLFLRATFSLNDTKNQLWFITSRFLKVTSKKQTKTEKNKKKTKGKQSIKIWELHKSMKHLEHNYDFTSKSERRSILRSFILITKRDKGLGATGVNRQHSYIDWQNISLTFYKEISAISTSTISITRTS